MKNIYILFRSIVLIFITIALLSQCSKETNQNATNDGFALNPLFEMKLVAQEPLVYDPVDMCFDENQNTYILEMPGYPFGKATSRLVFLRDNNEDGKFDERIVFADSLGLASSVMPYRSGFLVAAPPELLWIKDSNGDQKADIREVVMSGFANENLQHNYNGLTFGLDNWIYGANGGNDGRPYFTGQQENALPLRGNDFRFRINEKWLEKVGPSSGGFELAFDEWGNQYETHNLEHVSQLVFPAYYLEDLPVKQSELLPVISNHEENGLSRIYPIGEQETRVNHPEQSGYFSGSCGITFYGGNAFPEGYNNHLFVADVVLNLIHLDVLSLDKSKFQTSRKQEKAEFLASTDRSFRPVNMTTGPDGALYILDMHRKVIEHPEWIPDEIEQGLDINAGKDMGRIYKITPKEGWQPQTPNLSPADPTTLIDGLSHQNQWTRMTAQRLIVESNDPTIIPGLAALVKNEGNALGKIHALWCLNELDGISQEVLEIGLKNPDPALKFNAIKILELHLAQFPALLPELLALYADENERVGLQALLTSSRLDKALFHSHQEAITDALLQVLERNDLDQWTVLAISINARRMVDPFLISLFSQEISGPKEKVAQILFKYIGAKSQIDLAQAAITNLAASPTFMAAQKAKLIEALSTGWERGTTSISVLFPLQNALKALEETSEIAIIKACGKLRQKMGLPKAPILNHKLEHALANVQDQALSVHDRMELLQIIELADFNERAPILFALLNNQEPISLQLESLNQLWLANDPAIGKKLIELWQELGPEARKKASDILLYKEYHQEDLLTALENGIINMGEMNFDLERRRTLLWWTENESVKKRAEALFSDAGVLTRKAAIDQMKPALSLDGNIVHGEVLYTNHCSQCHRYGDIGKSVGPVLTEINRKSKASLLHDILDPNAAVDTKYISHQVKTTDGSIYTGVIEEETDTQITLTMMGGSKKTILKKNLEKMNSLGISLMPEGQEAILSTQDMADLLAFLQQSPQ